MTDDGRLFRHDGRQWRVVGDRLPPFPHAPPTPQRPIAPWVLPREPAPRARDVVVVGELAHQLLERCPEHDPAYEQLVQQTLLFNEPDAARAWLASVEVWFGRRLDPSRPWPTGP
ncbi:MAG: hypothetical protein AAFN30_11720 [Actinomycetota bacterium]